MVTGEASGVQASVPSRARSTSRDVARHAGPLAGSLSFRAEIRRLRARSTPWVISPARSRTPLARLGTAHVGARQGSGGERQAGRRRVPPIRPYVPHPWDLEDLVDLAEATGVTPAAAQAQGVLDLSTPSGRLAARIGAVVARNWTGMRPAVVTRPARDASRAALADDHVSPDPTSAPTHRGVVSKRTARQAPVVGLARGLSRYAETVGSPAR